MIWNRWTNSNSLYINGNLIGSVSTPNTAGTVIYDGGGVEFGTLYGWKHFGQQMFQQCLVWFIYQVQDVDF